MSLRPKFDRAGKVGRSLYTLVALAQKSTTESRTRVARVRNLIEEGAGDAMLSHKIEGDIVYLLKDAKLNSAAVALRKALRAEAR